MKVRVKAVIVFDDLQREKHVEIGDEFIVDRERAEYLKDHNAVMILEDIIEEAKQTIDEETKEEIKEEVKPIKVKQSKKRK